MVCHLSTKSYKSAMTAILTVRSLLVLLGCDFMPSHISNYSTVNDVFFNRLHAVLAQEPALRECRGEASGGALPFGGDPKVVQETAAMKAALRHTFQVKV